MRHRTIIPLAGRTCAAGASCSTFTTGAATRAPALRSCPSGFLDVEQHAVDSCLEGLARATPRHAGLCFPNDRRSGGEAHHDRPGRAVEAHDLRSGRSGRVLRRTRDTRRFETLEQGAPIGLPARKWQLARPAKSGDPARSSLSVTAVDRAKQFAIQGIASHPGRAGHRPRGLVLDPDEQRHFRHRVVPRELHAPDGLSFARFASRMPLGAANARQPECEGDASPEPYSSRRK